MLHKILPQRFSRRLIQKTLFLFISFCVVSCSNDSTTATQPYTETDVDLGTHKLRTYQVQHQSKYLVVFESGLGDGHLAWNPSGTAAEINELAQAVGSDILLYDRAGYGNSGISHTARNIDRLRSELEQIIQQKAQGRKVILVGHSLGGMIIRDYAIKNPTKVAALLFVDSMHEGYNNPAVEDYIYQAMYTQFGVDFGGTLEARELAEDIAYGALLPQLPNVPVVALTSMKDDATSEQSDLLNGASRQQWYQAHEQLGNGLSDFTHIATVNSGHYIQLEEPELVIENILLLLSKLPK